ncbi:hypothetical protein F8O01_13835 [Pseudoclavibacter chungangensis]|uniref:AAA family ATPase n=1 Tax=Pseudoclavibacter chungangensis TaxID=587635 RepID=A0A7J5BNZ0_9MICO|nr:SbcC/MukB-like Walker B domain-containing protein [Pseudoclavibacter chungangensis]KAB1654310.1 hypothetical protein F8O01_13835 [Pseudoclavibacter chungangensis]NYJ65281.1 uncharacterized protein YPO0396 [Pseudoclavibacter chungangensis]
MSDEQHAAARESAEATTGEAAEAAAPVTVTPTADAPPATATPATPSTDERGEPSEPDEPSEPGQPSDASAPGEPDEFLLDEILAEQDGLERDTGMLHSGQFRIELVQLLNWGSYGGLHRMPVGRGGIAILGPTGRGKSTILDAMAAVIMPNPQEFNRAARDDARQRAERTVYTYARGKTDEVKDANSDRVTTRFLRPLGREFASGAAITWRTELGETLTAARLVWIGAETSGQDEVTSSTVYLLARGEFDLSRLSELRADAGASSPLTRGSLSRLVDPATDLVTTSQPELRVRLCRELGIGGSDESQLKALTLLRRAQASKGVFSIDELFKQFVLTEPRALSRWETTLGTYREASALYDVFETTRRKLEILESVPGQAEQYRAASEDATGKRRLLAGSGPDGEGESRLRVWLAGRVGDWVHAETERVRAAKRELVDEAKAAAADELDARRAHDLTLAEIADQGGDPTQSLREQLRLARLQYGQVDRERQRLERVFIDAGLPLPGSEEELRELAEADGRSESGTADVPTADEEARRELAGRIQLAKLALAERERQRDSFRHRRSNVPDEAIERRRRIAEGTGIPVAELPYAGELFEVDPEHRDWTRAIERVVGDLAMQLLVDTDDFPAVRRYVDEHDLRGRLTLVPAARGRAASRTPIAGTVPSMLRLDERSPFVGWLRDELVADRSVLCVETSDELGAPLPAGVKGAVTRNGLRTGARDRVVKDDRRLASWIGLDNAGRVDELETQIRELQAELDAARVEWDEIEVRAARRRKRAEALERAADLDWADIDTRPSAARVAELQERIDRVSVERPELDELRRLAAEHDEARLVAVRRAAEIQRRVDELEATHAALVDIEDAFGDALADAEPLTPDELALLAPLPFQSPREAADVERSYRDAAARLREQIDAHDRQREQHERLLVLTFERYLELDRNAGIDATIDSLPAVLAIHRTLVEDDLPHAKADWLAKVGTSMGDSLRALLTQIEEDGHAIRRGVRPISQALRGIEFRQGSTLDIDPKPVSNSDLAEFKRVLRTHTAAQVRAAEQDPAAIEREFLSLRRDLAKLEERSKTGDAWRRRVLDAREHFQFRAIETRADGTQLVHEGVAGKSGGEGQELIAFVLGAALRYRLGDGTDRVPSYAPIVLDEGFVKADNEYTGRSLAALRGLGFQLVVGAPRDKVNAFEEHVDSVAYVSGDPADPELSRIYSLTIGQAIEVERRAEA